LEAIVQRWFAPCRNCKLTNSFAGGEGVYLFIYFLSYFEMQLEHRAPVATDGRGYSNSSRRRVRD